MKTNIFHSLNFKLVVINALRELGYFKSEFDELLKKYWNEDNFDYKPISEIINYCKEIILTDEMLSKVKIIEFDGGTNLYNDIIPNWDGEDDFFDVKSIKDLDKLPNLEKFIEISILEITDYSSLLELDKLKEAYYLSCDDEFKKKLLSKGVSLKPISLEKNNIDETPFFNHYNKTLEYQKAKEYKLAIKECKKAIEIESHQLAHYKLGDLYKKVNDFKSALNHYTIALDIQPGYSSVLNDRAFLYYQLGQFEKALKDVNQAIELNGEYGFPLAEATKAEILFGMGDEEGFFNSFEKALKLGINPMDFDNKIGEEYGNSKRYLKLIKSI